MTDTVCPVCGRSDYYQGKPTISSWPISLCCNGTCSPDCARTKAVVDAIKHFAEVAVWISTPFMTNYLPKIP